MSEETAADPITKSKCTKCKVGFYRDKTDLEKCEKCPVGQITEDHITCTKCEGVRYQSLYDLTTIQ